jgi:hypothetical protein
VSEIPELVTAEVVGPLPIVDAVTGNSVRTGGTVRLDPTRTVISWLVDGGHIRLMPAKAGKDKG